MPDDEGTLSEAEFRAVIGWMKDKWIQPQRECPISGPTNWEVSPQVFAVPTFSPKAPLGHSRAAFPAVAVTCENCGYTLFFGGVKLGLYPEGFTSELEDAQAAEAQDA